MTDPTAPPTGPSALTRRLEAAGLRRHALDASHAVWSTTLPEVLQPDAATFEALWALHPERYHRIMMHGREVKTPRWQQAYGADYHYTGRLNRAQPLTPQIAPFLSWGQAVIEPRLNGVLFNWYEAAHKHYIGKHRDSTRDMIEGTPIVTISLGASRTFRLRPWKGSGHVDLEARGGAVFVLPWETNLSWTHEVPHFARDEGRRVSITLRAFSRGADAA